jgi:hypothetical protein
MRPPNLVSPDGGWAAGIPRVTFYHVNGGGSSGTEVSARPRAAAALPRRTGAQPARLSDGANDLEEQPPPNDPPANEGTE